jgi:hypothetical protein
MLELPMPLSSSSLDVSILVGADRVNVRNVLRRLKHAGTQDDLLVSINRIARAIDLEGDTSSNNVVVSLISWEVDLGCPSAGEDNKITLIKVAGVICCSIRTLPKVSIDGGRGVIDASGVSGVLEGSLEYAKWNNFVSLTGAELVMIPNEFVART